MISGLDPGMFQDWRDWGRELVRRNQINSLAKQIAAILVSGDGIPFAFDAKKNTITLALGTISPADIAGLNESIDDQVVTLLQAGTNIGLSYNDSANQLTISADGLDIKDEGVLLTSDADVIDFVGAGVTATTVSGGVQISIPGASGGGGVAVRDEGSTLTAAAGFLDFVGAGVGATTVSGGVQVSIPGAAALGVRDEGTTLTAAAGFLDFVGAGVAATTVTGGVQVSVPGGGAGSNVEGRAHVVPALTDFTWTNQGSATATQYGYGIGMRVPGHTGASLNILRRATPATPYSIITRLNIYLPFIGTLQTGMVWRESGSGKLQTLAFEYNGGFKVTGSNYNSPTSFSASFFTALTANFPFLYFRMSDDGTNRSVAVSMNGDDWLVLWSNVRTTFITPDQIGFYGDNNNASANPILPTFLSWEAI